MLQAIEMAEKGLLYGRDPWAGCGFPPFTSLTAHCLETGGVASRTGFQMAQLEKGAASRSRSSCRIRQPYRGFTS